MFRHPGLATASLTRTHCTVFSKGSVECFDGTMSGHILPVSSTTAAPDTCSYAAAPTTAAEIAAEDSGQLLLCKG